MGVFVFARDLGYGLQAGGRKTRSVAVGESATDSALDEAEFAAIARTM